jgi:hypothetical protein
MTDEDRRRFDAYETHGAHVGIDGALHIERDLPKKVDQFILQHNFTQKLS